VFDTVMIAPGRAYTVTVDGTVTLWDVPHGSVVAETKAEGDIEAPAAYASGVLVFGDALGNLYTWDGAAAPHRIARHAGFVRNVVASPDGRWVVSSGDDPIVRVTSLTGDASLELAGHEEPTWGLAVSHDGSMIATGAGHGAIRLWRRDGTMIARLDGHTDWITSLRFTRDGRLISTSADTTMRLWTSRGEPVRTFAGHGKLVNSITLDPQELRAATTSPDGTTRIWDLLTGAELLALQDHGILLGSLFLREGALIATIGDSALVRIWDSRSGHEVLRLPGHGALIWRIMPAPDERFVTSSFDGKALIWQLPR
jgi:WD40 repeat protein